MAPSQPMPIEETDPLPLAFDFIEEMGEAKPKKAAKGKLSTVVSVPNAQAKAAKKKPRG